MSVNYNELVEKTLRTMALSDGGSSAKKIKIYPSICVSRDPGSGGRPIAKITADALGYKFYNSQLMNEIAKSAKLRRSVVAEIDEQARTQFQDLLQSLLNPAYVSEQRYIYHLSKTIMGIALTKGKAVFLGRGANFILPSAYALRVRVTAPHRVRVMRAVEHEKVGYEESRLRIKKITEERAAFVRQYFGKNIRRADYYDLVINTTFFSLPQARDIILKAFHKKFPRGVVSL